MKRYPTVRLKNIVVLDVIVPALGHAQSLLSHGDCLPAEAHLHVAGSDRNRCDYFSHCDVRYRSTNFQRHMSITDVLSFKFLICRMLLHSGK